MAQEACGFGGPPFTSTRHMRQLPAIDRRSWIAEARNFRAGLLAGLQQRIFGRNIDLDAIDDEFWSFVAMPYSAATRTGSGCGLAA